LSSKERRVREEMVERAKRRKEGEGANNFRERSLGNQIFKEGKQS